MRRRQRNDRGICRGSRIGRRKFTMLERRLVRNLDAVQPTVMAKEAGKIGLTALARSSPPQWQKPDAKVGLLTLILLP